MTRCDAGKILITRHLAAPWEDPPGPVPSTYSPSAQFGTLEALGETQLIKARTIAQCRGCSVFKVCNAPVSFCPAKGQMVK